MLCLNMTENMATEHKSTFQAYFFVAFLYLLALLGVRQKECLFLFYLIKKNIYLSLLKLFFYSKLCNYLYLNHIFICTYTYMDLKPSFYNLGPCEICVCRILSPFLSNNQKQFCRTKKTWLIPTRIDLGPNGCMDEFRLQVHLRCVFYRIFKAN